MDANHFVFFFFSVVFAEWAKVAAGKLARARNNALPPRVAIAERQRGQLVRSFLLWASELDILRQSELGSESDDRRSFGQATANSHFFSALPVAAWR